VVGRGIPRAGEVALVHRPRRPLEVVARAERAAGAAQADHAHRVVGDRRSQRGIELVDHPRRHRVQPLRPVEREGRDGVVDLDQELCLHARHATRGRS
jgi:hypothetical protein